MDAHGTRAPAKSNTTPRIDPVAESCALRLTEIGRIRQNNEKKNEEIKTGRALRA
jgi:hypothetical protein